MAKGKRGQKSGTRDALQSLRVSVRSRSPLGEQMRLIEDLRSFDFEPETRPARLFSGFTASVGVTDTPKKSGTRSRVPYQIAFQAPAETLVCVRRSRRRQVLFAKHKTGKGGQRRPRRSKWSNYKC